MHRFTWERTARTMVLRASGYAQAPDPLERRLMPARAEEWSYRPFTAHETCRSAQHPAVSALPPPSPPRGQNRALGGQIHLLQLPPDDRNTRSANRLCPHFPPTRAVQRACPTRLPCPTSSPRAVRRKAHQAQTVPPGAVVSLPPGASTNHQTAAQSPTTRRRR